MKTNTEAKTNKKHRWYDVIVAWAEGKKVQFKWPDVDWIDFNHTNEALDILPAFNADGIKWRIKPETITKRYRMALLHGNQVIAVDTTDVSLDDPPEYNIDGFIRWIGVPAEVELEVK